ncbi:SDR family NAD(P)-dependent oxidoreductase [Salinarimonas sp. NSM]|uniref:SDR family NAD(P)-dependent oxidoreductase n=1 Tax=Salinarimonas sp. NSM TaxID=3458003 RepID=UPI004037487F
MAHPSLKPGATAVVTGGAAGIGLAAARRFARADLNVVVADLGEERLAQAAAVLDADAPRGGEAILARACDVSSLADLVTLEAEVAARFGGTDVLMLNAGIQPGSAVDGPREAWERILAVNLWGVINGAHAFVPGMRRGGRDGLVVVTGSKQGITTPPGDPAYNVSKAGVKAFAEALAHDLRQDPDCRITAHLLIPGFVFTGLTARGRTEKPAGAWTPEETVTFMLERIEEGDFYVLCPDNEVTRAVDEKRILWAAGDIVENRPALSRWHPDWADAFATYMRGG